MLQEYAADIQDLSAFWFDNDDDEQGGDALMLEGFGRLADSLAEGVEVRCSSEVIRITRGRDRCVLGPPQGRWMREWRCGAAARWPESPTAETGGCWRLPALVTGAMLRY